MLSVEHLSSIQILLGFKSPSRALPISTRCRVGGQVERGTARGEELGVAAEYLILHSLNPIRDYGGRARWQPLPLTGLGLDHRACHVHMRASLARPNN